MCPRTHLSDGSRAEHDPAPAPQSGCSPRHMKHNAGTQARVQLPALHPIHLQGLRIRQEPHLSESEAELTKPNTARQGAGWAVGLGWEEPTTAAGGETG